jgi:hypothetical protein
MAGQLIKSDGVGFLRNAVYPIHCIGLMMIVVELQ